MGKIGAIIALAAIAGAGCYIAKKVIDKKKENPQVYAEAKAETRGDKIRNASMFAVGTIRTTGERLADTVNSVVDDVVTKDMVKKGEQTVEQVKETTSDFKKEIDDLKNLVTSINTTPAEVEEPEDEFADVKPEEDISIFEDEEALFEEVDVSAASNAEKM